LTIRAGEVERDAALLVVGIGVAVGGAEVSFLAERAVEEVGRRDEVEGDQVGGKVRYNPL